MSSTGGTGCGCFVSIIIAGQDVVVLCPALSGQNVGFLCSAFCNPWKLHVQELELSVLKFRIVLIAVK